MEPFFDDQGNLHFDQAAVNRAVMEAADDKEAETYIRSFEESGMSRDAAEAAYYGREGSARLQEKRSLRVAHKARTPEEKRRLAQWRATPADGGSRHVGESEHSSVDGTMIALRESDTRTPVEKDDHERYVQALESIGLSREAAEFAVKGRAA